MSATCHYRGDQLDRLSSMAQSGHLFGPDSCGAIIPGEVLGRGAMYEYVGGEYDPETDRTTAQFRPYIPPEQRGRIRYYGGDTQEIPAEIGAPTLFESDTIKGH